MSKKQLAGAPLVMQKRGKETDALVLREVKKRPGCTIHDIAERLDLTNGRVDGSVNRLLSQGKVKVKHSLRRGNLIKEVYPKEYVPKPHDVVEIPRNMIDDDLWKETVEVYALSRSTIAISPRKVEDWDRKAFIRERIPIRKGLKSLQIELPSSISDFYQLDNSETSLSTTGNLALVTIESTTLPVALPPTYPAEAMYVYRVTHFSMVVEQTEVISYLPLSDIDLVKGEGEVKQIPISTEFYLSRVPKKTRRFTLTSSTESNEIPVEVK